MPQFQNLIISPSKQILSNKLSFSYCLFSNLLVIRFIYNMAHFFGPTKLRCTIYVLYYTGAVL